MSSGDGQPDSPKAMPEAERVCGAGEDALACADPCPVLVGECHLDVGPPAIPEVLQELFQNLSLSSTGGVLVDFTKRYYLIGSPDPHALASNAKTSNPARLVPPAPRIMVSTHMPPLTETVGLDRDATERG